MKGFGSLWVYDLQDVKVPWALSGGSTALTPSRDLGFEGFLGPKTLFCILLLGCFNHFDVKGSGYQIRLDGCSL